MNNKTKVRLHLSKNLFESIAKEILAEAKKPNDGYSVAVKQPKMPKQSKSQATSPEVQKTDAEATMGENKPTMPKVPSNKPKMPPVPGQKPAMPKVPGKMEEYIGVDPAIGLAAALATLLGVSIPVVTSIIKDLKNAKTPEDKKKVVQSLGNTVQGSAGAHLNK